LERFPVDHEINYDGLQAQTREERQRPEQLKVRIREFLHARGRFLPQPMEEKVEPAGEESRLED
jgi:hypothetical protein